MRKLLLLVKSAGSGYLYYGPPNRGNNGNYRRRKLQTFFIEGSDGKKLVYSYCPFFGEKSGFYWIDPDGKNREKQTDGEWDYYQLEWLPQ